MSFSFFVIIKLNDLLVSPMLIISQYKRLRYYSEKNCLLVCNEIS